MIIRETSTETDLITLTDQTREVHQVYECKPCPFCGGSQLTITDWWDDDGEYAAISCLGCKAEAPATTWNNRR